MKKGKAHNYLTLPEQHGDREQSFLNTDSKQVKLRIRLKICIMRTSAINCQNVLLSHNSSCTQREAENLTPYCILGNRAARLSEDLRPSAPPTSKQPTGQPLTINQVMVTLVRRHLQTRCHTAPHCTRCRCRILQNAPGHRAASIQLGSHLLKRTEACVIGDVMRRGRVQGGGGGMAELCG